MKQLFNQIETFKTLSSSLSILRRKVNNGYAVINDEFKILNSVEYKPTKTASKPNILILIESNNKINKKEIDFVKSVYDKSEKITPSKYNKLLQNCEFENFDVADKFIELDFLELISIFKTVKPLIDITHIVERAHNSVWLEKDEAIYCTGTSLIKFKTKLTVKSSIEIPVEVLSYLTELSDLLKTDLFRIKVATINNRLFLHINFENLSIKIATYSIYTSSFQMLSNCIPKSSSFEVTIKNSKITADLKSIISVAKKNNIKSIVKIANGCLTLMKTNIEYSFPIGINNFEIGFNAKYMLKILQANKRNSTVKISFTKSREPIKIVFENDTINSIYIIMPVELH